MRGHVLDHMFVSLWKKYIKKYKYNKIFKLKIKIIFNKFLFKFYLSNKKEIDALKYNKY